MTSELIRQPTRLYVGGLPHDVSPDLIAQRFKPFGIVQGVELAPEKKGCLTAGPILKPCRGFAFLNFTPKDDAALHRCISMYNGCKWMGGVLRVEPATLHYTAKLAAEKADELQHVKERKLAVEQSGDNSARPQPSSIPDLPPLNLIRRDGKKTMKTQPNRVKTYFPPVKQARAGELSWDPLEPPPGALTREQIHALLSKIPSSAPARSVQAQVAKDPVEAVAARFEQQETDKKAMSIAPEQQTSQAGDEEEVVRKALSGSSEELAAVDFMDSDAEAPPAAERDSRFDSSDDDDDVAAPAAPGISPAHGAATPRQRAVQKTAGAPRTAEMQVQRSAEAAAPRAAVDFDSSGGDEEGAVAAGVLPAGRAGERDNDDVSKRDEVGAADDRGDGNETVGGLESDSASSSGSEEDSDGSKEAPGQPEGASATEILGPGHTHELEYEMGAQHRESNVGYESSGEAEHSLEAPAEAPGNGGTGSDADEAGSAHGSEQISHDQRSKDVTGRQSSDEVLAGLARVLPKGAAFCRSVGGSEVEAAWRAARDSLVADYKSKRRTALKQLPAKKRSRFHT